MIRLRPPAPHELGDIHDLCMRSKAFWGYDAAFMALSRPALAVSPLRLSEGLVRVGEIEGALAGVVQVTGEPRAELDLLFVEPDFMRFGVGARLFQWAEETLARGGAREMWILADPGARPFYEKMGAVYVREAPSDAIPGRTLPLMRKALT